MPATAPVENCFCPFCGCSLATALPLWVEIQPESAASSPAPNSVRFHAKQPRPKRAKTPDTPSANGSKPIHVTQATTEGHARYLAFVASRQKHGATLDQARAEWKQHRENTDAG